MSPRQRNGTNPNVTPAVPLESHSSLHVLFLPHGDTPPAPAGASLTPPCPGFLVLRPQRGGPQCRGRQQPARRAPHPPPRRTPLQVTAEATSRVSVPLVHSHGRCGEQASDGPPDYPNSPPPPVARGIRFLHSFVRSVNRRGSGAWATPDTTPTADVRGAGGPGLAGGRLDT